MCICIRNQTNTLCFCREDNPLHVFTLTASTSGIFWLLLLCTIVTSDASLAMLQHLLPTAMMSGVTLLVSLSSATDSISTLPSESK